MKSNFILYCIFIFISFNPLSISQEQNSWVIKKTYWSDQDEQKYSDFIQALGEAREQNKCRTVDQCLKSDANPYRESDSLISRFYADCADLPYVLRAYFAWKNALPFGYVTEVSAAPGSRSRDIRYSPLGNIARSRNHFNSSINSEGVPQYKNPRSALSELTLISSAMFRFDASRDVQNQGELFFDFYPIKLNRESVKPGTVIYDPNGHVAVVYKVESDGRVLFIDGHPDNSLTRGTFGEKFTVKTNPGMGAGFKNWRPIQLVGAQKLENGNLIGGKIIGTPNNLISDYSVIQFYGTENNPEKDWKKRKFIYGDQELDFYSYVRNVLSIGRLIYKPMEELKNMLSGLCQDLIDRADAVNLSLQHGINNKSHPEKLPYNIYGTDGEWEEFSTPSRDARFKTSFLEAKNNTLHFIKLFQEGSSDIDYTGGNLILDLLDVYTEESQKCSITYTGSNGNEYTLNLDAIMKRLFLLSFDPYHCIELRWGETDPQILSQCPDNSTKRKWYDGLQRLRNQIDRKYDDRMDFNIEQIFQDLPGNGVATPPDIDIEKALKDLLL